LVIPRKRCALVAQFVTADAAVAQIRDGDCIATTGSGGGVLEPDSLLAAVEARFVATQTPRNLTLIHALGIGDRGRKGTNAMAHEGLVQRVIGGHWTWSPRMMELAATDRIEAYSMPSGVITHLLRESGAGRPGLFTKTGLGTFADPRQRGCRANAAATEEVVSVAVINDVEYLHFRPFHVDVAFVRGTESDHNGNISAESEASLLDALECAQAARGCGGIVIAQVKRVVDEPLDPRRVSIPAVLVDFVVESPDQRQTYLEDDPNIFSLLHPDARGEPVVFSDPIRAIVARRAAMEISDNSTLNLGFGMSADVGDVLRGQERLGGTVRLAIEQGLFDGIPATGDLFGISRGPSARVSSAVQFDIFASGILDTTCLGMAEADAGGNVNVSRFGNKLIGPGGFIDISQYAKKAVFCGSFMAKGLRVHLEEDRLVIDQEGAVSKFVDSVEEITFSGELCLEEGRHALYVTERCVFELTDRGMQLIEVAPGIDIEHDILAHMGFTPIIGDVRPMPDEVFRTLKSSCLATV